MIQLQFFVDDETLRMKEEIRKLKESNERVRKSLFAKHGELAKNYLDVLQRLEILERNICTGKIQTIPSPSPKKKLDGLFDFAREA